MIDLDDIIELRELIRAGGVESLGEADSILQLWEDEERKRVRKRVIYGIG